ncbi:MAG: UDP-3-O-acyl-N-acetylglucosamine deacetylase [Rickettsiales bacterium]|jgi:UDP-3-O-[3-hydroxymyristoyl] N-acetylglucosamine deacetylase|nr:UDP-3-O-acyl-N-acetylglucosamine deacetylase [Rickettsiales bacterium]
MKKEIKFSGVGIHSGKTVNVRMLESSRPGVWFRRIDLPGKPVISALWDNVQNTGLMSTSIGKAPAQVQTIEHFMAALFVCGISDIVIELDGAEFPIMDGGAAEFIKIFKAAGFCKDFSGKKIIVKKEIIARRQEIIKQMPLLKRIMLWLHNLKTGRREDGFVKLSPNNSGLLIKATLVYPDKIIGTQSAEFLFDPSPVGAEASRELFIKEIANSRTFGRIWEWEYLKKRGMGQGANENNVIALNDAGDGTLNGLHYPDEFARHKLIDAAGDIFTAGGFVHGTLESFKGSHGLNNLVLRKLFSDPENYDIIQGISNKAKGKKGVKL